MNKLRDVESELQRATANAKVSTRKKTSFFRFKNHLFHTRYLINTNGIVFYFHHFHKTMKPFYHDYYQNFSKVFMLQKACFQKRAYSLL